jgi:hypothetical protein
MSRMPCVGPSATRTRTAAKRADRRPFMPRRQLTLRQRTAASMASAAIDLRSGNWGMRRCRGVESASDPRDVASAPFPLISVCGTARTSMYDQGRPAG